jgi:hypothetical protein
VVYLAAYRSSKELYFKQEIQQISDQMLWVCAEKPQIQAERPQDLSFMHGDIIEMLKSYARIQPGKQAVALSEIDEVLVMGSTGLLIALQKAFKQELKSLFSKNPKVIGTVGSPMQCMLKGVCAQCLQWQIDPETGERTQTVFTCAMQDQALEKIDLENLSARQKQNKLTEYLTAQWVGHVLDKPGD